MSTPELEAFATALLVAAGTPPDLANRVATSLVSADLCGLESHGVMRLGRYISRIRDGTLLPASRGTVAYRRGANAVIDGEWGFGQISAQCGVQLAIDIAGEHGQAGIALAHTHHIGRLGEYAAALATAGFAALIMSGGGACGGAVAPHGSRQKILGTNPLAMAIPTATLHPLLVLDFSTAAIPEGKVAVAKANGRSLPPGCLLNRDGDPTENPADLQSGGALLPFGGHKGSALAVMIELLATTLAGSVPIALPGYAMGNPTLMLAWAIEGFISRERFERIAGELIDHIHRSPTANGFAEVLLPGELEARLREQRLQDGIPISEGVWNELIALAATLHVTPPRAAH